MNLSIIIPVYNIEAYISKCLESVFAQPLDDFEVVCVNDGSTDNSQSVIDSYAAAHPNLRCIRQSNKGLSEARNTGIDNALGRYLFFLDGDDYLSNSQSLADGLGECLRNNLDLLVGNAVVDGQSAYLQDYPQNDGCVSGMEMMRLFMGNNRTLIEPVWCYLYSKSFLDTHRLRFKKGIYHEDVLFTPQALYLAERCMCRDIAIVDYQTRRAGAITTTTSIKHLTDKRDTARELYGFFQSNSALEPHTRRIVFDVYTSIITSASVNKMPVKDIIMPEDRDIMSRCAITMQDRKTVRLLQSFPALSAPYISNALHPIIRKAINRLPV